MLGERQLPPAMSNLFGYIWCRGGRTWPFVNDVTVNKTGGDVRVTWSATAAEAAAAAAADDALEQMSSDRGSGLSGNFPRGEY